MDIVGGLIYYPNCIHTLEHAAMLKCCHWTPQRFSTLACLDAGNESSGRELGDPASADRLLLDEILRHE